MRELAFCKRASGNDSEEGVKIATDSILSGRALEKLEAVVAFSEKIGQKEAGEMTILDKFYKRNDLKWSVAYRKKIVVTSGKTRPSIIRNDCRS